MESIPVQFPEDSWWEDFFPSHPHANPPGNPIMLRLIAYDISDPKRLRRVCEICEDHGSRVQKSIFECWLEGDRFDRFWKELSTAIDKQQDSIIAYTMDTKAAEARRQVGSGNVLTEKRRNVIL